MLEYLLLIALLLLCIIILLFYYPGYSKVAGVSLWGELCGYRVSRAVLPGAPAQEMWVLVMLAIIFCMGGAKSLPFTLRRGVAW